MKKLLMMGSVLALFGMGVIGCQNTAEGVKEDAANTGQAVSQGAENAGAAAQDAAKDVSAAVSVTPKVKTAITADPELNDTRNRIDVDTADNVVHLKGHVTSNELKRKAGEIAQKVLNENNSTDKLSNELVVQ